jgi:ABC-type uncharacterized transport system permease subunit
MKIFWSFARQNFHALAAYRFDFFLRASSIIILMYGTRWLWITLYTQRPGAFGLSLQQMVDYSSPGWVLAFISPLGALLVGIVGFVWRLGLHRYSSSGS